MRKEIKKIIAMLPPEREKPDLSGCEDWYVKNACGSCGEEYGHWRGYNHALKDIKILLEKIVDEPDQHS